VHRFAQLAAFQSLLSEVAAVAGEWAYIEDRTPAGAAVIYVAPGLGALIGVDDADAASWWAYTHPDDLPVRTAREIALQHDEPYDIEYRLVRADGRVVWARERGRGVPQPDGTQRVFGVLADTTSARETREVVQRISHVIDEYVYTEVVHADGSREPVFATPGLNRLLGQPPPGVRAEEAWRRAVHPADQPIADALLATLRSGQPAAAEYRLVGYDGVERWVEVRCRVRERHTDGGIVVDGVATDITDRKRAEAAAADAEQRLTRIVSDLDEVLYTDYYTQDGTYHEDFMSPNWRRLIGAPITTPRPSWYDLVDPRDDTILDRFDEAMQRLEPIEVTYRIIGVDGRIRYIRERGYPHRRDDGVTVVNGILSDVTSQVEAARVLADAHDQAERLSRTDPLTGVFNRRHFNEALAAELARAQRVASGTGLLCVDIDHFKVINDLRGHLVGDDVLCRVAERITSAIREYDVLARFGGEEFVVLLPGISADDELRAAGERVRRAIESDAVMVAGEQLTVTVSVGAAGAVTPHDETLIDLADRALFAAKRAGRNRTILASQLSPEAAASAEPVAVRLARTFAIAAGAREGMPANHLEDVADLSARVAQELHLSSLDAVRARLAGFLHDVGKVAVPDRILLKRTSLDDAEWRTMHEHAVIGAMLVQQVPELAEAADAVRHHHERYDGDGYPDGLAGDTIPLIARIVACVDAYSAMTSDRVYSLRRAPSDAILELRRCAGSHFDPAVVEALVGVLRREGIGAAIA
jgi:diguanylate cyclase (GGDEF)-like protein/putative nucleotidyltransferase with HDIG domain/PAS domain S-box-containing protein